LPELPDSVCGVTLADAEAFGRMLEGEPLRLNNSPVRDVDRQSYWDFMLESVPGEDKFFSEDVMKALRGWQI